MAEQNQSITINVKTLDAKTFSLTVPHDIEVTELKKRICEHSNVPEAGLRVIFQGKVLKDGTTITSYGIKTGHTVHMVARPPGTEPPTAAPSAQQQNPPPQPNAPPRNPMMGPGVMLGSITIPDGTPAPNINQILGPVFSSLGLPPNLLSNLPQPNRPTSSPDESRRQVDTLFNTLSNDLSSLETSSPSPSFQSTEAVSNGNNVQNLGNLLSQVDSQSQRLHPYIMRLSNLLQQEPTLENNETRNEAQALSRQVGNLLQQLGSLQIILSSSLNSLQMGTTPSQAQVENPGHQQRHVITPTSNITIHIQNDPSGPTTTSNTTGVQGQRVSVPMFTLNPRNTQQQQQQQQQPNTNNNTTTTTTTAPAQQPNTTTTTSSANNTSTSGNPPPVNPLQNLFAMLNQPRPAPPANTTSTSTTTSTTTSANTQQAPNPLAQMMQNLLQPGQLQNMMQAVAPMMQQLSSNPNMTSLFDAHNRAQGPTGNPATSTTVPTPTNISNPQTSALMSQTYQAVSQALNSQQSPSVSTVLGNIAGGENDQEEEGALQEILSKVLDTLTIPDMMSVMGGNWTPIERLHPVLESYIRNDLLNGDTSERSVERLTDVIMSSINESMGENNLHADIKRRVKPGYEVTSIARHIFRKYLNKLIKLVLVTPSSSPNSNSTPFAMSVKEWTSQFVGELVSHLSTALNGGVGDASILINYYLQERLLFLGPEFSQMATNMVTSYIMNTYSQSSQTITNDPSTWTTTISVDEIRQQQQQSKPLSDAYQEGSKKRKSPPPPANMDMAVDRLEKSMEGKEEEENDKETIEAFARSNLPSKYIQFIKKELKDKISRDPDYDPKKFPNSSNSLL